MEVTYTVGKPARRQRQIDRRQRLRLLQRAHRPHRVHLTVPRSRQGAGDDGIGRRRSAGVHALADVRGRNTAGGSNGSGWNRCSAPAARNAFGSSGGAKAKLETLKAVNGGVEKLDQQTVRGHLTTRYKASVESAERGQVPERRGRDDAAREVRSRRRKTLRPDRSRSLDRRTRPRPPDPHGRADRRATTARA